VPPSAVVPKGRRDGYATALSMTPHYHFRMRHTCLSVLVLVCLCRAARVQADAKGEAESQDPFAYDLRIAISPVAFQTAVSQTWLGSAIRVEYSPLRQLDIMLDGRAAWHATRRRAELAHSYVGRVGVAWHFAQSVRGRPLYGTVYATDAAVSTGTLGTDHDVPGVTSSERLRTALPPPKDRKVDPHLMGLVRDAHSLRLGIGRARTLQLTRLEEDVEREGREYATNDSTILHFGYSYTLNWNLPANLTGKDELGYRRLYADVLFTPSAWTRTEVTNGRPGAQVDLRPFGARLGMQGALEGLLQTLPSLGVAYDLEIGMYPGRSGYEAYLFVALGVAFDVATRG